MHLKSDASGANSHFSLVPRLKRPRSSFKVAEKHITTMQFDYLFPVWWKMVYPGDSVNINVRALARLQTQVGPLYDDLYVDLHAWYCPFRLLQTNWARFQFNDQPGGPSQSNTALTTPNIDLVGLGSGGFASKSLYDYLGYPTKINATGSSAWINNYPARMYNFVWNNFYRDQNNQNPVTVDLTEGPDTASNYVLLKRGKRFDRFTACLPNPQKGTAVSLPLGTSAPVQATSANIAYPITDNPLVKKASDGSLQTSITLGSNGSGALVNTSSGVGVYLDHPGTDANGAPLWIANLANATAATVNQLRSSVAIQHLLEADARGGTRDIEAILNRFGVQVPDFRLQRPEYLGGATFNLDGVIVPQTSSTSGSSYQAGLAQFSQGLLNLPVNHAFLEHGIVMVLASARSNITYQQGLQKELAFKTRYDFYQPEFANIGEVAVLGQETYFNADSGDAGVFGYQEYGYERRYGLNRVSGEMRSNYSTPLDSRHMADKYASRPSLGSAWIVSTTPIDRNIVVASGTADPIQLSFFAEGTFAGVIPMYSVPGLDRL